MIHEHPPLRHILYIEDDEGLARLLQRRMERMGFQITLAFSGKEGLHRMAEDSYDLILLDYNLPDITGLDVLDALSNPEEWPPIIILTAGGDERVALAALKKGAADYAVKDTAQFYFDLLPAIMQTAFTRSQLMRDNIRQREELAVAKEIAESANQAKSDFLATMSHEIRTPLNAVTGLARLLERTQLDAKQKEMMETLRSNADMLLRLVNELLDLSRIESGQIVIEAAPFSVTHVMRELHAMFDAQMAAKALSFTIHDRTEGREFVGDSARIQQIMINLVGNALKFTGAGGITVTATAMPADNGTARLEFSVSDTGMGIPADKCAMIFERFVQSDISISKRFGGSGLGLAICKTLAEKMGGSMKVESDVGKGSTFTFALTLPLAQGASTKAPAAANDTSNLQQRGTVLLVEDYPANIMVARLMLNDLGFEVDVAETGTAAIDKVKNCAQPYQAIFMDVEMHDMSGLDATRTIRQLEEKRGMRHTIIGLTAHAFAGSRDRCLEAGMDHYMTKPIDPELLAEKLNSVARAA